jgi:hypothetical protein
MGPLPFESTETLGQGPTLSALLLARWSESARDGRCDPGTPPPRASTRRRVRERGEHKTTARSPKAAPRGGRRGRHNGRIDRRPTAESLRVPESRSLPSHRLCSWRAVGLKRFVAAPFHTPCNHHLITELPPMPVTRRSRSADRAFAALVWGDSARIACKGARSVINRSCWGRSRFNRKINGAGVIDSARPTRRPGE